MNLLWFTDHHLAEFVKVHAARAILIQFLNDGLQLRSLHVKHLSNQSSQGVSCDESLTLLVIKPECILQFPLHGLNIGILNKKECAKLAKLSELNLPRTVLINLLEDVHELLLAGTEPHGAEHLPQVVGRQKLLLLGVKQVEAVLEAFDLVIRQVCLIVDLLEVDIFVGVNFKSHICLVSRRIAL